MSRRAISSPAVNTIRIMIVESRALLGVGVREVLDREPDIEIVAQVRSPEEAMPVMDEAAPNVLLVDAPTDPASSDATRRLRQEAPDSALVILGGEDDDASIVDAFNVGAAAHVAELAEPSELIATIRRVADGEDPLKAELSTRPDLVDRIVDEVRETILADRPKTNPLTTRELDVLILAAAGFKNREIGEQLGVSEQTVKNHLSSVMHKLGVPNRTQAVTYAVRQGWLVLGEPTEAPGTVTVP